MTRDYAGHLMKLTIRGGAAALVLAAGLSIAALPASAKEIDPPEGSTPVVGMAMEPGTSQLWLAGPKANSGTIVEARSGDTWSFGGDATSVQALAWSEGRLWVGDIGDQSASREHITVFRLAQPDGGRSSYRAYDFKYEDGARDAKAMLISGRGNIYVVSAGSDPGIYRAPSNPSRDGVNTLTRVADAPQGVTDGVFLTDGSTMALRTATGIAYVDAFTWKTTVTETLVGAPADESIAVSQNDEIYVGGAPTIRTAEVPASDTTTTVSPQPQASTSPSGEGSPEPSAPQASPAATADSGEGKGGAVPQPQRTGTIVAIALAGLLAVAAGAVTWFVRR